MDALTSYKEELERISTNTTDSENTKHNFEKLINTYTIEVDRLIPMKKAAFESYTGHKNMIAEFGNQISEYYSSLDEKEKESHHIVYNYDDLGNREINKLKKIVEFGGRKNSGIRNAIREYNNLVDRIPAAYTEYESISKQINDYQYRIKNLDKEIYKINDENKKKRKKFLEQKIREEESKSNSSDISKTMMAFLTNGIREMPRSKSSNFIPTITEINEGNKLIEDLVNTFTNDPDETMDIDNLFIESDNDTSDDVKIQDEEDGDIIEENIVPVSLDELGVNNVKE